MVFFFRPFANFCFAFNFYFLPSTIFASVGIIAHFFHSTSSFLCLHRHPGFSHFLVRFHRQYFICCSKYILLACYGILNFFSSSFVCFHLLREHTVSFGEYWDIFGCTHSICFSFPLILDLSCFSPHHLWIYIHTQRGRKKELLRRFFIPLFWFHFK